MPPRRPVVRLASLAMTALLVQACGGDAPPADGGDDASGAAVPSATGDAPSLSALLADRAAVFGTFSGPMTPEQGAAIVENRAADFVLYSMESGPFDVDAMRAYMEAMDAAAAAAGVAPQPVILRVPPIHADTAAAADHVNRAMEAGVAGLVFPYVTTAAEAATSVRLMGEPWPLGDAGLDVLIVEDREGVSNVREIMATPGLSVVFAGPSDLRRAYEGDMEAVENAIQAVLAACLEFEVACGVTAGADDIAMRLDQGFRVIIVTEDAALAVGRSHVGR